MPTEADQGLLLELHWAAHVAAMSLRMGLGWPGTYGRRTAENARFWLAHAVSSLRTCPFA